MNFGTPKNLLVITKQSFLLAKKHILFHISVKLNAFNIKLKSIVPEVIQRLCAKFGANWPIGGTITDVNTFFAFNFHILKNTFVNIIFMYFPNRARFSDIGPTHFCCTFPFLSHHTLININGFFLVTLIFCCNNRNETVLMWGHSRDQSYS